MNWTGSHFRSRQTEVIRSKATDQAGLVSYRVLEIQYLDDIAPSIQFDRSVVNVFQGTTAEELREQLLDATTFRLWDNIDSNPQISLKDDADGKTDERAGYS